MAVSTTIALPLEDISQVAEARRAAASLAGRVGFDETLTGRVALIATEMARNLILHARGGRELLLRPLDWQGATGVELLALDRSPGMDNVAASSRDGFSTGGTPGTGLGAIRRLATVHDIISRPARGTAVLAQVWAGEAPPPADPEVGAVSRPKPGEMVSGDGWYLRHGRRTSGLLIVDGLGHGSEAADAANEAIKTYASLNAWGPADVIGALHASLRRTRGAAAAAVEFDPAEGVMRYAGIGNIAGVIESEGERRALVSLNGTLGAQVRRVQEFVYPWPAGALAVFNSDGLSSQWTLLDPPGLAHRHPGVIAGVLYRDFARGTDDATVVVARAGPRARGRPAGPDML